MFKKIGFYIICLFFVMDLMAQSTTKQTKTPPFLMHTVKFGETLSQIAVDYKVVVDDILKANPSLTAKSLMPDQILRIPNKLNRKIDITTSKTTSKIENDKVVLNKDLPTVIIVETGQTLYSISKKYNVRVEDLAKWNNLTNYDLKIGTQLTIKSKMANLENKQPILNEPVKKELQPKQEKKELIVKPKEEIYKAQELKPKTTIAKSNSEESVLLNDEVQVETKDIPASDNESQKELGSVFKSYISNQKNIQKIKGTAAPMTTTLGTVENTYFAMHRTLSIGTIIKIKNLVNSKIVYAKIIGKLPETQENKNVIIRYSLGIKVDLQLQIGKNYVQIEYPE
jgi:LysM repeat protein